MDANSTKERGVRKENIRTEKLRYKRKQSARVTNKEMTIVRPQYTAQIKTSDKTKYKINKTNYNRKQKNRSEKQGGGV